MIVISLFIELLLLLLLLLMLCGILRGPRPLAQVVGNLPEAILREGDPMSYVSSYTFGLWSWAGR